MVPVRSTLLVGILGLAACGDGPSATPDAAVDADPSMPCGADGVFFTGELLDFASTGAAFKGIADATFTVRGDEMRTDTTAPNGRFELCLSTDTFVTVDVTPAVDSGYVPGTAIVSKEVASNGAYSIRSFTQIEGMNEFNFDSGMAHVFVHVAGAPRSVSVSAASERSYAFDGNDWRPGDRGSSVFIANIDPAEAATKLTVQGQAAGVPPMVPLEAGKLTYVVVMPL